MQEVIVIKYGELSTKKANKNFFIKTLSRNIKNKLKDLDVKITNDFSRMFIEYKESEKDLVINKLSKIFGIYEFFIAKVTNSLEKDIFDISLALIKTEDFETFKVETKRSDKTFPMNSLEFSAKLGAHILKNHACQVDVKKPDLIINVEIRQDKTYVYTKAHKGLGGYPVGVQGKALLMLSGGIDSPVAGYLSMKRGITIEALYFESLPHTSLEAREKIKTLCKKLSEYSSKVRLHIVSFTELQEAIYRSADPAYGITLMRRMMYRISEKLAKKIRARAIVNGESIGQVASQTLTSMQVINEVTNMPIIRPVACLDKLEIIEISKKIDTYETSILPFDDCCSLFVPIHPVINPDLKTCLQHEEKIPYEEMIDRAMKTIIIEEIVEDEKAFTDLL